MVVSNGNLSEDDRKKRWIGGHRQRFCCSVFREYRSMDLGPQYVRTDSRSMARRFLERLVGPQSALPYAGLCAHALRAARPCDGRGYDLPFCYGRTGGGFGESEGGGKRKRH